MTTIPAQRDPNAHRVPDPVIRTDLHKSPAGQLIKVEVGDGWTRVTAELFPNSGRWSDISFTPEVRG